MSAILTKYAGIPEGKETAQFRVGDTVAVYLKVKEGGKERIQVYRGLVIAMHRRGVSSSFTVRKISYNVGVERVFPLFSPSIDRIERVSEGKVRRAKLYYLRDLTGRKARISTKESWEGVAKGVNIPVEGVVPAAVEEAQA